MEDLRIECHIDSHDVIEAYSVEGDVRIEIYGDSVYLDRAAQERLRAWLGDVLGYPSTRDDATSVSEQWGGEG